MNSISHLRQSIPQQINSNFCLFQQFLTLAEHFLNQGHYPVSVACAQIASCYAFTHHCGLFVSPRLENILQAIGQNSLQSSPFSLRNPPPHQTPKHVLHVLTYGREVGGDTRFVWRWIQEDFKRRHSVVLTRQQNMAVPKALSDSVSYAGGNLYVLKGRLGDLIPRAQELRNISTNFDLIVLHLFPDDVVPFLAFANKNNVPPIIYINLSDHTFWLGVSISDVVGHLRTSGLQLSKARREIENERTAIIPIPLGPIRRTLSRSEAKKKLGYSEKEFIILTIATPFKYLPIIEPSFVDAILPVLEKHKNAILLAIGPDSCDQWAMGNQRTEGRILALGKRTDTATFYEAADIYVDSFPFASITSLLEAGSYGIPLVSYRPHSKETEVLSAGAPGLTDTLIRASDLKHYEAMLSLLIEDDEFRSEVGEYTKAKISDFHTGRGWNSFLKNLYFKALTVPTKTITPRGTDQKFTGELDTMVNCITTRLSVGLGALIDTYAGSLPYTLRLRLLLKLLKFDRSFSLSMFLPKWIESRVEGYFTWCRDLPGISRFLRGKEK